MAFGGGYFKTTYAGDLALIDTRLRRAALGLLVFALIVLPRFASPFVLDLVAQTALAAVGALALNLLTGLAGQISLGHAGFIAAGAFTTAVLVEHRMPSPLLALPAAALVAPCSAWSSASPRSGSRGFIWPSARSRCTTSFSTRAASFRTTGAPIRASRFRRHDSAPGC